ncbi:serine/threonine-protein kinase GRIK1-like isoform X3 [Coffea eugenioides]|uniref:serine/threonine-protein kinase GRIK1-like isoform X3 n=1 Tax=Coffea eugenioides TaxID=49369 RepID=UPI000F605359|nr:serine/threonine-protein kinase GRIK1-like isoform X3 [Coffea eugenioides]
MLVHGDITLDNLLVATSGIVKIGDFSISQLVEDENDELCCSTGIPIITTSECCIGSTYHSKVAAVWVVGFTRMIILYRKVLLGHTLNSPTFPPKGRRKSKSDVKERFGAQVLSDHCIIWKRFYHVAWPLCPCQTSSSCVHRFICFGYCIWDWKTSKGDFTKLDFDSYNGPSRGYNQLGSIGYSTE